ncbi:hypothetical protein ABMA46_13705 [Mesorhizobium sp. CN5-321]|jgi:hypothetical protein|uniref:hypothetical protein n=1 Tax=Mesorhizobium hunchu TaxID=3157708 RepID=UPI0032B81CF6
MSRSISTFALVVVLTALLTAFSLLLVRQGYGFGAIGVKRLDGLASSASFIPLAALYFLGVALLMILPLRAAAFVLVSAVETTYLAALVLFATIVGCLLGRVAFGQFAILRGLLDWQFVFVAAIVVCHALLNELRRNVLLRSLMLVASVAATLACLYWAFRF